MSHTNQTPNYHLPQFIGTDKPAWLVDFNQAMSDIDTQMKSNETAAGTAEADAQSALSGVTALNSQVGGIQTSVTALETQAPLDEAQIETNRQNIATNAQNIVDLDNRMGHTSISGIGDGSATGAIKAIDDKVGDLADLDTTDKSSIVNAINEALTSGGDEATVRYDEATEYIQLKDAQGWFNWRKASRAVWDAILNSSILTATGTPSGYSAPTLSVINDKLVITSNNSQIGAFYIQPETNTITLHVKGTIANGSSYSCGVSVADGIDGNGDLINPQRLVNVSAGNTVTVDNVYTVQAGKYVAIECGVNSNTTFEEFWAS